MDQFCEMLLDGWILKHFLKMGHTLDLLKSLSMELADLDVFLFQNLEAPGEGKSNLQVLLVGFVITARTAVVEGLSHLPDGRDHLLGFLNHALLFGCHDADLIMQRFGEGGE